MADLRIHELAFGGRAFEPLSDEGRDWCDGVLDDAVCDGVLDDAVSDGVLDDAVCDCYFLPGDACMAGIESGFGCEPCDFDDLFDDASGEGLILVDADGNPIAAQ